MNLPFIEIELEGPRAGLFPLASVMQIEPDWIDYNGHLNMAYYNVIMDRFVDETVRRARHQTDYLKARQRLHHDRRSACALSARGAYSATRCRSRTYVIAAR